MPHPRLFALLNNYIYHIVCDLTVNQFILSSQLFGEHDPTNEDDDVSPDLKDEEANVNAQKLPNIPRISTRDWAKEVNYDAKKLFNKFFDADIKVLLSMARLWETRRRPTPLTFESALKMS